MQAFWSTLVFPPFNVTIQNWLMLASKQISHSSTKVHLIFQVMTWARVLLLSFCSLNLAHVVADQALAEDLCKGQQGQMLWQNFSIYPTYKHLCFPTWNIGPYGSAEKASDSEWEKTNCIFAFATYPQHGWTLSRYYCRLQSWEKSTRKDLSGWYFIRKHIWV